MRTIHATSLATCLLATIAGPGFAQGQKTLRAETSVAGDTVRYGDLVEGAGENAGIPLFRAPALGGVGSIRADRIAAATQELGHAAPEAGELQAVIVRRPARVVSQQELEAAVRGALTLRDPEFAEADLSLDTLPAPLRMAATGPIMPVTLAALDLKSGRFTARMSGSDTLITGTAGVTVALPVLTRPLSRGDVIQPHDLVPAKIARRALPAGAVQEAALITGSVARRPLAAGQPLREADVARPELVEKNQAVTVTYATPGLALSLRGKALAGGALGATVAVVNPASKRTIEAVVTGPGQVSARLDFRPAPAAASTDR